MPYGILNEADCSCGFSFGVLVGGFGFLFCFGAKTLGAGSSVMPGENPRACVYTQQTG